MKEIGMQFKEARTDMEISLEEVADDLKVDIHQIEEIENGNLKAFDDIVNLKYFLKDYAKYLGLDYESVVNEYNEFLFDSTSKISLQDIKEAKKLIEKKEKKNQAKEMKSPYTYIRKKSKVKKIFFILLILSVLTFSVFVIINQMNDTKDEEVVNVIR